MNCSRTSLEDTLPATVPLHVGYPPPSDPHIAPKVNSSLHGSIFDALCQSVDNDYIAHPTDCKQYAYCANGKKRRDIE